MNPANLSFPQPAKPEPAEPQPIGPESALEPSEQVHTWLRMDPSLTQAVLAKTEEELLGGLAALMRNKVEAERAARRLTQVLIETQQAQKELDRVRQQVRQAEDELALRLDEQQRLKLQASEDAARALPGRQESGHTNSAPAGGLHEEWAQLQKEVASLRRETGEYLRLRETLIQEIQGLSEQRDALPGTAGPDRGAAQAAPAPEGGHAPAEQTAAAGRAGPGTADTGLWLEAAKRSILESDHAGPPAAAEPEAGVFRKEQASAFAEVEGMQRTLHDLREKRRQVAEQDPGRDDPRGADPLLSEITGLESYTAQLRDAHAVALKADEKNIGLPLWFGEPLSPVAEGYDPYRLESEFFTDEPLDAAKVVELVAGLPGLDGCLLLRNRGPVLAARLAEHYFEPLRVPGRDYELLFTRLPSRRDDVRLPGGRVATYQLENGFLTVTQAGHIFMITTSGQPRLRPGMTRKLVAIAQEVAKMYPENELHPVG